MRQHKFCGKRLDNGEWVIGYFTKNESNGNCYIITQTKTGGAHPHRVDPETVREFTGLKDKNGVDIYEGDIVKRHNDSPISFPNGDKKYQTWMGRSPNLVCFKCDICGNFYHIGTTHKCSVTIKQKRSTKMKGYIAYTEVTKNILDTLQVGDFVKVNDWKKPMRIMGVSENYTVMIEKQFGNTYYSVIEKKPWDGVRHNAMVGGYFHCGKDDWIFSDPRFDYKFNDNEAMTRYLQTFEDGEAHLSERNAIPLMRLQVKKEQSKAGTET